MLWLATALSALYGEVPKKKPPAKPPPRCNDCDFLLSVYEGSPSCAPAETPSPNFVAASGARCGGPGRGPPWLRAKSCEQCLSWCVLNKFGFPCVAAVYDRTTRGCELFEKACDLVPAKDHATFSLPPPEEPAKEAAVDVAKPVPAPKEAAPIKVDVLDLTKPSTKFVDSAVPAVNASANVSSSVNSTSIGENATSKEDSYESYSYGWWPPEASPSPDPDPESSNATDPELLGVVTDEEVDPTLENDENGAPITHTMSGLTGAGVGDEVDAMLLTGLAIGFGAVALCIAALFCYFCPCRPKEKVLPPEVVGYGDRDLSFGKKDLSFARTGSKLSVSV